METPVDPPFAVWKLMRSGTLKENPLAANLSFLGHSQLYGTSRMAEQVDVKCWICLQLGTSIPLRFREYDEQFSSDLLKFFEIWTDSVIEVMILCQHLQWSKSNFHPFFFFFFFAIGPRKPSSLTLLTKNSYAIVFIREATLDEITRNG